MIEDFLRVLVAIWIAELLAVLILLLLHWKETYPVYRVPDFVPPEWSGGDRTQTRPDREPHR